MNLLTAVQSFKKDVCPASPKHCDLPSSTFARQSIQSQTVHPPTQWIYCIQSRILSEFIGTLQLLSWQRSQIQASSVSFCIAAAQISVRRNALKGCLCSETAWPWQDEHGCIGRYPKKPPSRARLFINLTFMAQTFVLDIKNSLKRKKKIAKRAS